MNRGSNSAQTASAPSPAPAPNHSRGGSNKGFTLLKGLKLASVLLLFSVTVLLVALLWFVVRGNPASENKYVESDKYQAVFLINQQLPYFAKVSEMNNKYVVIQDIYYLSVNQQVQPNTENQAAAQDISLVKLGCELHGPQDRMVINREQVVFWENLKDDGKVVDAIKRFKEANPNGLNCNDQSQSQNTSTDKKQQ